MTKYAHTEALVVGGTGAIGLAIAKRLVEGGATVLLTAGTAEDRAHAAAELGSSARVLEPAGIEAVLAAREGDGVDLLFAGSVPVARPLLGHLSDGGALVLTSPTPCPDTVRALAAELAGRGIRVNAVAPGCIEAPGSGAAPCPRWAGSAPPRRWPVPRCSSPRRRRSPRAPDSPSTAVSAPLNRRAPLTP